MIGLLVTGHGTFATGITSGLKLLAGEPESYEAVDFDPEDSVETLTARMEEALLRLSGCEQVLILTDLTGGSPFNVALRLKLSVSTRQLEVIGGINLPTVLDAYMSRPMAGNVKDLAAVSSENGKSQIVWYIPSQSGEEDYED